VTGRGVSAITAARAEVLTAEYAARRRARKAAWAREKRRADPEYRARNRERYRADPEYRAKIVARMREKRRADPDGARARNRAHHQRSRERYRADPEYRARELARLAAWKRERRRQLKRADPGRAARERAERNARLAARRADDPGYAEQQRQRDARAHRTRKRDNAIMVDTARRHGRMWTGPELEVASRDDLTAEQAAVMLGRTLFAVETARRRLRQEPRYQSLAGLPS
jgi:hypothetical protein